MSKAHYKVTIDKNSKVSISQGNIKLGKNIYNFNLLPGDGPLTKDDGELLSDIPGTCKGVCEGCKNSCYAIKMAKAHCNTVIPSNGKNTLMVRADIDNVFNQIKEFCSQKDKKGNPKVKIFRFHSSGEIENYEYLLKMDDLAAACPGTQFYVYTKQFDFVQKYIKERGIRDNLVINISEWKDNTKGYDFDNLNRFVWDDGDDEEVAALQHCPAIAKPSKPGAKGKATHITCEQCGLCWRKNTGRRIAVYNH